MTKKIDPLTLSFQGTLYHRNNEQELLISACSRVIGDERDLVSSSTEFILIHGKSGVGKTSLAQSVRSLVHGKVGYFVSGKFDQSGRIDQYSAFHDAVTDLCNAVISRGDVFVDEIRRNIESFVKSEQRLLTEMIPALNKILNIKEDYNDIDEKNDGLQAASGSRFKFLFRLLVCAIASHKHPVLFLLDDLQWADESSIELLYTLLTDSSARNGVCYIGTYRDDCCNNHLTQMICRLQASSVCLTDIRLDNWSALVVNSFLSEVLNTSLSSTASVADYLYSQTKGNPFHVIECLRSLHSQSLLTFDSIRKSWLWDIEKIRRTPLQDSLLEQITLLLHILPPDTKDFLTYASCLGTTLDERLLKHFCESFTLQVNKVAENGLIVECDNNLSSSPCTWRFSHDIIREAIYTLIPSENRNDFHYHIGRHLWRHLTVDEIDVHIFAVVGQLLHGIDNIKSNSEESTAVAKLCLRAGERAVQVSHFRNSMEYLSQGITLLRTTSWQNNYDLCLRLHNAAIEVAYCNGDFDYVHELVDITASQARILEHKVHAITTNICTLGTKGHFKEAVEVGILLLSDLGVSCPLHPSRYDITREMSIIKRKIKGKSYDDLLRLPAIHEPQKISALKVLSSLLFCASMVKVELAMFLGLRLCRLTLDHGQSALSPTGFILYGLILSSYCNRIEEGFRMGEIGLQMFMQYNMKQWIGRVYALFYGMLYSSRMPLRDVVNHLKYASAVALENGDVEYGLLCGSMSLFVQFETSTLSQIKVEMKNLQEAMAALGQDHNLVVLSPLKNTMQQLCDYDGTVGTDTFVNDSSFVSKGTQSVSTAATSQAYLMLLHYLFGNVDKGNAYASICMAYLNMTPSPFTKSEHPFILYFIGLSTVEKIRKTRTSHKIVRRCVKLLKFYAKHAPCNVLNKQFHLEAEIAALKKNNNRALIKFTCAIALSENAGFVMQTALCYERIAKFFISTGEVERARSFVDKSISIYRQWGSNKKADHLQQEMKYFFDLLM